MRKIYTFSVKRAYYLSSFESQVSSRERGKFMTSLSKRLSKSYFGRAQKRAKMKTNFLCLHQVFSRIRVVRATASIIQCRHAINDLLTANAHHKRLIGRLSKSP